MTVDGARERSVERLLGRFPVLVFTPDRLRLVQGAPALRRAYFDRVLARLWPRLARRLGRVRAPRWRSATTCCGGCAPAPRPVDALDPWDALLAEAGAELIAARARLLRAPARRRSRARLAELGGDPRRSAARATCPTADGEPRARCA